MYRPNNISIRAVARRFAERPKQEEDKRARRAAVAHLLDWAGSSISISKITDAEFARYKAALGPECSPKRLQLLRKLFTCLNKANLLDSTAWKALGLNQGADFTSTSSTSADSPTSNQVLGDQSITSDAANSGRVIHIDLPAGFRVTTTPQGIRVECPPLAETRRARGRIDG
jgi:hypothetical protein